MAFSGQPTHFGRWAFGQVEVRNVDVGFDGRMIDVAQKTQHALDIIDERQPERLQLQGDLQIQICGVFG